MGRHTDFCCDGLFELFEDGVVEFNPYHVGDTRDLVIKGTFKKGDGTEGSSGFDFFKIIFCPLCGELL